MSKITAIIIDDEKEAREGIALLLEKDTDIEVLQTCKNGIEAIEQITDLTPDIIFLDIQMPGVNGFEVLNSLPEGVRPLVIFVTAFDDYTLKAFEVHATDYLLKPFTDERFYQALAHAKEKINSKKLKATHENLEGLISFYRKEVVGKKQPEKETTAGSRMMNGRLIIKSDGKIIFLKPEDIVWVQAYDYYVRIHEAEKFHLVRDSLKHMEEILPKDLFLRIHKSSLVNVEHLEELEPFAKGDYVAHLSNGEKVRTSRGYRDKLKGLLEG